MQKLKFRMVSLLLALLMVLSLAPAPALAAVPEVGEGRAQNAVRFNPNFKFWNRWISGNRTGSEYFVVPFDTASGAVMFCVDPGVPASTNPKNYTMYVGARSSDRLRPLLVQVQSCSGLQGLQQAVLQTNAGHINLIYAACKPRHFFCQIVHKQVYINASKLPNGSVNGKLPVFKSVFLHKAADIRVCLFIILRTE